MEWIDDEMIAKFVCRACSKTFYNANALQNHKNLQHEMDGSSSDGDIALPTPVTFTEHVRTFILILQGLRLFHTQARYSMRCNKIYKSASLGL